MRISRENLAKNTLGDENRDITVLLFGREEKRIFDAECRLIVLKNFVRPIGVENVNKKILSCQMFGNFSCYIF